MVFLFVLSGPSAPFIRYLADGAGNVKPNLETKSTSPPGKYSWRAGTDMEVEFIYGRLKQLTANSSHKQFDHGVERTPQFRLVLQG